ncbi:glycoside hydrolase N-terminal domain-containing protein, partial [Microbacterium hibisci]|uniref:glycoside hydrolase N-terminal domain-containing protein n=1 Tax=Microbacterium hibisci TaxID=2036000 RepID=UPI001EF3AEDE
MSTRRDDAAPQAPAAAAPELAEGLHALRASAPASRWLEAYPVGNGLRGAMCAGLVGGDRLWLNDITAWSGQADADPLAGVTARGATTLAEVRAAIDAGDLDAAEALLRGLQAPWVQAYLPLGWIDVTVETDAAAPRPQPGPGRFVSVAGAPSLNGRGPELTAVERAPVDELRDRERNETSVAPAVERPRNEGDETPHAPAVERPRNERNETPHAPAVERPRNERNETPHAPAVERPRNERNETPHAPAVER